MPVTIFFCYAHEDEHLLNKLKAQLKPLQRRNVIDVWYDRNISAGTEWEHDIDQHLNTAQIILLLVSPDFMNSDYCYGIEMKRALERHERKEAVVIPIILRHVYWQEEFGKLQVLPTDAKPVIDRYWHSIDEAFFDVVGGIRKAIEKIAASTPVKSIPHQNEQLSGAVGELPDWLKGILNEADKAQMTTVSAQQYMQLDKLFVKYVPSPIEENLTDSIVNNSSIGKFTASARKVLSFAQEEAQRFQHRSVGTEHLLLGLIREDEGIAAKVLADLGVKLNKARSTVEFIIGRGNCLVLDEIELNAQAQKAIGLAANEAHSLHAHYIGTEHLLLALISENESVVAVVFKKLNVNLEKVRAQTLQVIGPK